MTSLPSFDMVRVLCLGDVMLDRFIEGRADRISPESPVPVIRIATNESVPGGAANVCRNISSLGGRCTLIGAVGEDAAGAELRALLSNCERIEPLLVSDPDHPTTEKIRFMANGQHVLRVDREEPGDLSPEAARAIAGTIAERIHNHDVLVLSDYAKGVLTDAVVADAMRAAFEAGVPVVVDPSSARLARYAGATVITPNTKEATIATGIEICSDFDAERAARKALADGGVGAVLLTRSEHGITLVTASGHVTHVPASAREVFDVVGAGDTVVAALALCIGAGLELPQAARIANAGAGVVVGKRGTATITRSELVSELPRVCRFGTTAGRVKVVSAEAAASLRGHWKCQGLRVGFTNGCFDLLHAGHVGLLEFARHHCDRLIVGVNSDASVKRLKGSSRPINREEDRAAVLAALAVVDAVVLFGGDTPLLLIEQLQPDLLVKGSDYAAEEIVGHDVVRQRGAEVMTFALVPECSTSLIIAKVARAGAAT